MENKKIVFKKKNGDIISIDFNEIESFYYGDAENILCSASDSSVDDASCSPLKYRIISDRGAEIIQDMSYKQFTSYKIPSKVRINGRIYEVSTIGRCAFLNTASLSSVEIPNSVTSIGDNAFSNTSLSSVEIPNSVTSIGDNAFSNTSLSSVEIPNSVTSIGDNAFSGCCNLESINVNSNNSQYSSEDGVLYNKDKSTIIKMPEGKKGEYVIPASVKKIKGRAFSSCSSLTNIVIPASVNEIGISAFSSCSSLTNIVIPASVNEIGISAFSSCSSLTNIVIPASVKEIGMDTFSSCSSLTNIVIPASVNEIGIRAFAYCSSLTNIVIPASVNKIGDIAFLGCYNLEVYIDNLEENVNFEKNTFKDCKSVRFLRLNDINQ